MQRLRSVAGLALAASVLLTGVARAGTLRLEQHLRMEGTQLDLRGTTAADSDLESLNDSRYGGVTAALPALAELQLAGTAATAAGIERLKAARPALQVHSDPAPR